MRMTSGRAAVRALAGLLACLLALGTPLRAQQTDELKPLAVSSDLVSGQAKGAGGAPFSSEQIEQLVAPIALYPDALVAQVLMASTYPLEVVQAARWSKANPKVTGKALEDALQKQTWDASVKSLTATPQVLAMMNDKLEWMQQLGDAFLASEKNVLDGVQRLRKKALDAGNLKTSKEQKVTTEEESGATIIKVEPANPEVVYVPVYNPTVIYGPWPYPAYPPYYWYPPAYPGGVFFAFSVGIVIGSAWWGGCHWGGGGGVYINHNVYNNFNRTNINNDRWEHRPEHRKGVEYRDQASRDKFGGQRPGVDTREAYRGRDGAGPSAADRQRDAAGARDRAGPGAGDRAGPGAGDRAGNRQSGAFDGVGNGAQARDYSNRGASSRASAASSMSRGGGMGGGGRMGGGGGRGGGRR